MGDFNGDKKLDLAVANYTDNTVTILLGNGDGTFTPSADSPVSVGGAPDSVIAGDFNGDGRLDLAIANSTDNTLTILLGGGDGTFTAATSAPVTGTTPYGLAVGDFNGDGKLDLAVANFYGAATILLGNGDGTFTAGASPTMPNNNGSAVVAGDFNGDGKLDLAVAYPDNSTVTILLGKGDGTFTAVPGCCGDSAQVIHVFDMVSGDFNGDGKLDLALAVENDEVIPAQPALYVAILLGNGDGTFTPTDFSMLLPPQFLYLAAGDFNNDGKLDLGVASAPYPYLSVLLQPPAALPAPDFSLTPPAPLTVTAGTPANTTFQATSLNGFTGPVSFTCS
ncbi:MAG TPA: VCBS repeat-containing protein, partial [Rhizomicrobium sp.]